MCVNLAQIHSAVPVIHCRMRVSRIERVSTISCIWHINGRQTITVNSGVSGPKFTKFLQDVDRTSVLLTSLTNQETNTRLNIYYTNVSTIPENFVKIGLVVSEISPTIQFFYRPDALPAAQPTVKALKAQKVNGRQHY